MSERLQPVVAGLVKGRDGERQRQDRAGDAEGQAVASELDADPAPPRDVEPVGEDVEALEAGPDGLDRDVDRVIQPGIDRQRRPAQALEKTRAGQRLWHDRKPRRMLSVIFTPRKAFGEASEGHDRRLC